MSGLQKSGRLVENYIFQIDRIFCSADILFATAVPRNTIFNNLRRLKKEGKIIPINGHNLPTYYRYIGHNGIKKKRKEHIQRLISLLNSRIKQIYETPLDDLWDQAEKFGLINPL